MAQFTGNLKKIGVFTSGGDAPGMNAATRAVVRTAIANKLEVIGIIGGYQGLFDKNFRTLDLRSMANIIQRGGTVLKTGRCAEFMKKDSRAIAAQTLREQNIDAMVCIGGDGSFTGANLLWQEQQFPIVGVPGTIDNDINGSDNTIGFDTAVNTAMECIDKIRDTAASHDRLFIVEVMGRNSGFIAAHVGLAGGAEEIFTPEYPVSVDKLVEKIKNGVAKGKKSSIIITAEGQKPGRAYDLAEQIRKKSGFEAKVCVLGHLQRGGSPTATDRVIASRMGAAAVQLLLKGQCDLMVGTAGQKLTYIDFHTAVSIEKKLATDDLQLAAILSM
jgi:6-phosphofructokinase 1